jgi:membrane protein YqaA with SNARE-associated domain
MHSEQLLNNVHFLTPSEIMIGAVCGSIAGFALTYWLGDHMDQIVVELREVRKVFKKKKTR